MNRQERQAVAVELLTNHFQEQQPTAMDTPEVTRMLGRNEAFSNLAQSTITNYARKAMKVVGTKEGYSYTQGDINNHSVLSFDWGDSRRPDEDRFDAWTDTVLAAIKANPNVPMSILDVVEHLSTSHNLADSTLAVYTRVAFQRLENHPDLVFTTQNPYNRKTLAYVTEDMTPSVAPRLAPVPPEPEVFPDGHRQFLGSAGLASFEVFDDCLKISDGFRSCAVDLSCQDIADLRKALNTIEAYIEKEIN